MAPATAPPDESRRVAGSFRDPSGYVFRRGTDVYRAIDQPCRDVLQSLADRGTLSRLTGDGLLLESRFVQAPALLARLAAENPGYEHFLQHRPVAPITYPYEWTVSMLADAGLHTLDLQLRLLEADCCLKDATAYNVQFVDATPTFIDLASIQRPARTDLWYALGQFNRMFTFPVLLCRHHGWDLRSYFLGAPDGRSVEQVARICGRLGRWRPRTLLDVALPCLLTRRGTRGSRDLATAAPSPGNSAAQRLNLQRLRAKLQSLAAGYRPGGVWTHYSKTCSYDSTAEAAKKGEVKRFLDAHRPECVLDLGCNTGDYSFLAAECGAQVVATDNDHDAVEMLYRRLRNTPTRITPMVHDLTCPSPAFGLGNRERDAFSDRVRADCVLALALIHHLLVTGNLSPAAVRDQLFDLTDQDLVLEYVPSDDRMFRQLVADRTDRFEWLNLPELRRVFLQRFTLLHETTVAHSQRTLLFLRKRV